MTTYSWVRLCKECRKEHNTGIENKIDGTFEPIETCYDCLMSKCSFKFDATPVDITTNLLPKFNESVKR